MHVLTKKDTEILPTESTYINRGHHIKLKLTSNWCNELVYPLAIDS